ncbi:signal peptidase I [bacterium CG_4_10_14_0_2_um_filter_33_32]|nr:MAG: signal peptidase I [bacterium CG2_30_33_46]PIR67437.1 MAG: signal peptidase I [bacterium CG10_big_fil_rev_8_21_14_0_10_33_18]PIU76668.1 MAG: signal peptidase I [bacterium CG06_land_8_20_14_3_00_33_50]PIW81467.1 MAG: signal peptidase I [bacterium CG_4_8_14_3_um_filter_33_28]PIY85445.1 MAG: signal peptidase I [bacterium CG_4_10_14_0_8_um_filter_33_57]PIZ86642.1 MAG: signal peptidase I [bacterium CG_4_10_14_0_2_um_filter_33_32]PJA72448.1 MAG: signal peptidase I [bacterium CG_4_9_14_3_um_
MKKIIFFIIIIILIAIATVLISVKIFAISGNSMESSLKDKEKVLVLKYVNFLGKLQRGDIILIEKDNKLMIKRIIALPKEKIEINEGKIIINDQLLLESYVNDFYTYGNQRIFLADGQYFVLGDNRKANESIDSRIFGPVTERAIRGKVLGIFSPNLKIIKPPLYKLGS